MSEFSKAVKLANQMQTQLAMPKQLSLATLDKNKKLLDETLYSARKYQAKITELDPVTGISRLGPAMIEKVNNFAALLDIISAHTTELLSATEVATTSLSTSSSSSSSSSTSSVPALPEGHTAPIAPKSLNQSFQYKKDHEHGDERSSDEILSHRAEEARQKKRAALIEEQNTVGSVLLRLKSIAMTPNETLSILTEIRNNLDGTSFKDMLSFIKTILQNITKHPDNEKLRILKPINPMIYEKISRHDSGLDLLVSLGFSPVLDTTEAGSEVPSRQGAKEEDTGLMNALSLKMTEPSPEADMQKWIRWFDGLSDYIKIVDSMY